VEDAWKVWKTWKGWKTWKVWKTEGDGSSISRRSLSVNVELVRKVVEDLVGGTGEATGRGESEVCSNEKVGQVLRGDLAGDGVVIAGRAGVLQNGLVVG
jgi:hypothetical protein